MGKTALVVVDSTTMREVDSYSLKEAGFKTVAADDGQAALDVLSGGLVDLIVTDLNVPVMDGVTFLTKARLREELQEVPILNETTESQAGVKVQGKAAGATGWLVRPLTPEMLLKVATKRVL
jgi:two-component system chemotaxis response regulator CheY